MENVFFIVGPHGSGKTYSVKQIVDNIDAEHIDLGPLIREAHTVVSPNTSLGEWIKEGEEKYGKNFTDMVLCYQIQRVTDGSEKSTTLITGSRSIEGIQFICNKFNIKKPHIIYIDAPFEQLKSNYEKREGLNLTNEEFFEILKKDESMGLDKLKKFSIQSDKCLYLRNDNSDHFVKRFKCIVENRVDSRTINNESR